MESRFQSDLEQLRMTILQMASLAETALRKATLALMERDDSPAKEVVEEDRAIDLLEMDVDRRALRLLALDQPKARDLRFIIGSLRIAVELERIGDDAALEMMHKVIDSFVSQDVDVATEVCKMDDLADDLNYRILKDALAYMANEAQAVERSVQTIIAARCLERAADQTTNIAESIVFIVKGVNIKHHCESLKEKE
jgi:phosphate transport system protein